MSYVLRDTSVKTICHIFAYVSIILYEEVNSAANLTRPINLNFRIMPGYGDTICQVTLYLIELWQQQYRKNSKNDALYYCFRPTLITPFTVVQVDVKL